MPNAANEMEVFARVVEHGFRFVTMQTLAERLQAAHVAP